MWLREWVKNHNLKELRNGSFLEIRLSKRPFCCSIPLGLCNFGLKTFCINCHLRWEKQEPRHARPLNFSSRIVGKGQFLQPLFVSLFQIIFLCSYSLFCFCFSLWAGSFVQTDLPLWMVSVSTNCHSVTPRQKSALENSQPPPVCALEHISSPNPGLSMDQTIHGRCSLHSRASPLRGSWPHGTGKEFVSKECNPSGGDSLGLKLGRVLFSTSDKNRIMMLCLVLI